jgi:TrmH RNA methyltransferase
LALVECRFSDILRIYLVEERVRDLAKVLKQCAAERKPYRVVTAEELEKITESRHHEGVCIAARSRPLDTLDSLVELAQQQAGKLCLLALEEVGNPHNVGAILRVAAHFGVDAVLIRQSAGTDKVLSSAAHRTSEGGAERVRIVPCPQLTVALERLRAAGLRLVSTSSHAQTSLYETKLPQRCVILLGAESTGLPWEMRKASDLDLSIPGAGAVESLNVSCAASVVLGEFWHQHRRPEAKGRVPRAPRTR